MPEKKGPGRGRLRRRGVGPAARSLASGLILALGASSCRGLVKQPNAKGAVAAPSKVSSASPITVFQSTVHAYARQNCASCHGASQGPTFALADPKSAYPIAKTVTVNASGDALDAAFLAFAALSDAEAAGKINEARLVAKSKDGHCGPNCSNSTGAMALAIASWRKAEKDALSPSPAPSPGTSPAPAPSAVPSPTLFTFAAPLPSPIPTHVNGAADAYARMRFSLTSVKNAAGQVVSPPALANAVFEIQVQVYAPTSGNVQGAYRFIRPRIGSPAKNLYVKGVRVHLDGAWDPSANDYVSVDTAVPLNAAMTPASLLPPNGAYRNADIPFPLLSNDGMFLFQTSAANGEQVSLSFEVLNESAQQLCKNQAGFNSAVRPVARATSGVSCAGCHGGASGSATAAFNMAAATDDATLCMRFRDRANLAAPASSKIVTYPLGSSNSGHPVVNNFNTVSQSWIDWVTSER